MPKGNSISEINNRMRYFYH